MTHDPHALSRFVDAQDANGTHARALAELRAGEKRSHWMWFVFPQIAGLGFSGMAQRYAIGSLEEARAYLAHRVLGPRLHECLVALDALPAADTDPRAVLGDIDAIKLRSSLTLFHRAAPADASFTRALARWFGDAVDAKTDALLAGMATRPIG